MIPPETTTPRMQPRAKQVADRSKRELENIRHDLVLASAFVPGGTPGSRAYDRACELVAEAIAQLRIVENED